ncbi:MAG TPA: DUF3311 domain-containing protein [Jatrophihabitantaceae bacterium]|jgi:hypothetical protein|nr:DUF3311 domain-containing protein [Jatrophihabitantaceae bacterium]
MTTNPTPAGSGEGGAPSTRPLPAATKVAVGVLLAIPLVALALVPTYSHETPALWGFPFFYWYQLLWVILTPLFTWSAYLVIARARRGGR